MAITQDRMLAVIASGEAWQKAWREAMDSVKLNLLFYRQGDQSLDTLIAHLDTLEQSTQPGFEVGSHLIAERRYYEGNAKRNDSAKLRAARLRRFQGKKVRQVRLDQGVGDPAGALPSPADFERATKIAQTAPHHPTPTILPNWKPTSSKAKDGIDHHIDPIAVNLAEPLDVSDLFK